jgi:two-component system cell cycle sensor histidine kinase/response regulator CckA
MSDQIFLAGNTVIAVVYAAITVVVVLPVVRAGQLLSNTLATATALIFFSCSVGHALHVLMAVSAALDGGAGHQLSIPWNRRDFDLEIFGS